MRSWLDADATRLLAHPSAPVRWRALCRQSRIASCHARKSLAEQSGEETTHCREANIHAGLDSPLLHQITKLAIAQALGVSRCPAVVPGTQFGKHLPFGETGRQVGRQTAMRRARTEGFSRRKRARRVDYRRLMVSGVRPRTVSRTHCEAMAENPSAARRGP